MNFDTAIERALGHEGNYVNDPRDPGGETNWGISKRSYPTVDIKRLTREEAKAIYRRDFWQPVVETVADDALRFQLLDSAINHGMGNAVRFLQRALGVADDGHWGPLSHASLDRMSAVDVHLLFMAERFEFWTKLTRFDTFGRGWTKRGAQNLRYLAQDNAA
jgi:lysozyme family protein